MEDFDLIVSSFLTQYGIRIYSEKIREMGWQEFKTLLAGLNPDTPLGRIVTIRSEEDKEIIKNFNPSQRRIYSEWRNKQAKNKSQSDTMAYLDSMKRAFIRMAGG